MIGNLQPFEQDVAIDVQQFFNSAEIIGQARIFPALGGVAGQIDGEDDVAYTRVFGVGVVHQRFEQLREVSALAERELQVSKADAEHVFLGDHAAQVGVGLLAVADFQR